MGGFLASARLSILVDYGEFTAFLYWLLIRERYTFAQPTARQAFQETL
jgi:hypothetical protein